MTKIKSRVGEEEEISGIPTHAAKKQSDTKVWKSYGNSFTTISNTSYLADPTE